MNQYLEQTKFATSNLINLISCEELELKKIRSKLQNITKHHTFLYEEFLSKEFDLDEHFNDHQMLHAFSKQAQFHSKHVEPTKRKIIELEISIYVKKESIKALSGALLQIAKQGISIIHGGLNNCPNGRFIINEPIKNIIWQGRNQALHYEEGIFNQRVVSCFQSLGIPLSNENLAKNIIDILEWNSYEKYVKDMLLLLD